MRQIECPHCGRKGMRRLSQNEYYTFRRITKRIGFDFARPRKCIYCGTIFDRWTGRVIAYTCIIVGLSCTFLGLSLLVMADLFIKTEIIPLLTEHTITEDIGIIVFPPIFFSIMGGLSLWAGVGGIVGGVRMRTCPTDHILAIY